MQADLRDRRTVPRMRSLTAKIAAVACAVAALGGAFAVGRASVTEEAPVAVPVSTIVPLGLGEFDSPEPRSSEAGHPLDGAFSEAAVHLSVLGDLDPLPAGIGLLVDDEGTPTGYADAHTRTSGSALLLADGATVTVRDLFAIWGRDLRLDRGCFGDQCVDQPLTLRVSVDGVVVEADPLETVIQPGSTVSIELV